MAATSNGKPIKYGIVAFAFALRDPADEPNPSNYALGEATFRAIDLCTSLNGEAPIVSSQWEITKALEQFFNTTPTRSVELRADGSYLDSKGVWDETKEVFDAEHVTDVIIIAQPWLHLPALKKMIERDGYKVIDFKVGPIPFDDSEENTQWWTRSRGALLVYALKTAIPGTKHGHGGQQNAT